jgi:hypothetical protein
VVQGIFTIFATTLTITLIASQHRLEYRRHKYERYERGEALYFSMKTGIDQIVAKRGEMTPDLVDRLATDAERISFLYANDRDMEKMQTQLFAHFVAISETQPPRDLPIASWKPLSKVQAKKRQEAFAYLIDLKEGGLRRVFAKHLTMTG